MDEDFKYMFLCWLAEIKYELSFVGQLWTIESLSIGEKYTNVTYTTCLCSALAQRIKKGIVITCLCTEIEILGGLSQTKF